MSDNAEINIDIRLDTKPTSLQDLHFMPIREIRLGKQNPRIIGLLFQPTTKKRGEFHRCGLLMVKGEGMM
jgi:hypothetical protein